MPRTKVPRCLYCGRLVPKRRRELDDVGRFYDSQKCRDLQKEALGLDLDEESIAVVLRGDPIEALAYFGVKAIGAIWKTLRERLKKNAEATDAEGSEGGSGSEARTPPPAAGERDRLLRELGLPPTATLAEAEKRYRELAKKAHPDLGGSVERMRKLNVTISRLREIS